MKTTPTAYTRKEAMAALGITSANAFYYLRRKYPQAFVVIHQGTSKNNITYYDSAALDQFIQVRNYLKGKQS